MISFKLKKNLFIILLICSVLLLTVNIFLQINETKPAPENYILMEQDLSDQFRNILNEFGIVDNLVKETKHLDKNLNDEISNFKVQVPRDLTIPEILIELFRTFHKDSLSISSIEKVKNGKTLISVKYGNTILLSAEFDYAKNYSRNKGKIAFIIYDVDLESEETEILLESQIKIDILVRPESSTQNNLNLIQKNGQQFSILIDDDISEQKYKLGPDFSEQRVINVIKTLVIDFKNSICFVVDENSNFYKSTNYQVFERELNKRKIKLFTTSDFTRLVNNEKLMTDFADRVDSLEAGESVVFLVNEEGFQNLDSEILKLKKQGYKVVPNSLILSDE